MEASDLCIGIWIVYEERKIENKSKYLLELRFYRKGFYFKNAWLNNKKYYEWMMAHRWFFVLFFFFLMTVSYVKYYFFN